MNAPVRPVEFGRFAFPGRLVVFCGTDGTGKSSVIAEVADRLGGQGERVEVVRQPSPALRQNPVFRQHLRGDRGRRSYRALSMLVMADRVRSYEEEILPLLDSGVTVLQDRGVFTQLARLYMHGDPRDEWFYAACRHLPAPTLAVLLHADPDEIERRLARRSYERTSPFALAEVLAVQAKLLELAGGNGMYPLDTTSLSPPQAAGRVLDLLDRALASSGRRLKEGGINART